MGEVVELSRGIAPMPPERHGDADPSGEKRRALEDLLDCYNEAFQLEQVANLAFTDPRSARDALRALKLSGRFLFVETAISALIMNSISDSRHREEDIRKKFYDNLEEYVPGATKVAVTLFPKNIPDGFVLVDGLIAPVEIKRYVFDDNALAQITRYMTAYQSELGFAVAPALGCELPANVRFVEVPPPSWASRR